MTDGGGESVGEEAAPGSDGVSAAAGDGAGEPRIAKYDPHAPVTMPARRITTAVSQPLAGRRRWRLSGGWLARSISALSFDVSIYHRLAPPSNLTSWMLHAPRSRGNGWVDGACADIRAGHRGYRGVPPARSMRRKPSDPPQANPGHPSIQAWSAGLCRAATVPGGARTTPRVPSGAGSCRRSVQAGGLRSPLPR